MSQQGEEALATWLRIMENPRATELRLIYVAAGAVARDFLGASPAISTFDALTQGYLARKVPMGSAQLYMLTTMIAADLLPVLGLDPWLLDTPTTPEAEAAAFNERYPVGTEVVYWAGSRDGTGSRGRTRSDAFVGAGNHAYVPIAGKRNSIPLSHVDPVQ